MTNCKWETLGGRWKKGEPGQTRKRLWGFTNRVRKDDRDLVFTGVGKKKRLTRKSEKKLATEKKPSRKHRGKSAQAVDDTRC